MRPGSPPYGQVAAIMLVAVSGFLGGAVFGPGLLAPADTTGLKLLLVGGFIGSLLFTPAWLAVSALLAGRAEFSARELARRLSCWFALSLLPLILYFPYMYYRTGLEGESAELPPLESRYAVIVLLLWSLLLLATLLHLNLSTARSRPEKWIRLHPGIVLAMMMGAWLAVFFPMDVLKDHYMHTTTINSAVFKQSLLNVFDERGFLFSSLVLADGASIFAVHLNAIILFILPLFRIWPDYKWLLLISDAALALSAIPAYHIARRYFATGTSLLLALMLLLHPIMAAQPGRSDFSELRFAPLLILSMFYFFETRRFWSFAAFALLLMTIREDMGLIVAFFGIYALLLQRSPRWILAPIAGGAGWFAAANFYLLPHLNPEGRAIRANVRYSNLGSSGGEIARTILLKPWKLFETIFSTPSHMGAAYGLFLTFGAGVTLLSAAVLLAVPPVAELLLQSSTTLVNFMALTALATLMIAYLLGLARLDRIAQRRFQLERGRAALVVGVIMFFICLSVFHTWFNPNLYRPRYNYNEALAAYSMVPGDASLMLPEFMLAYGKPDQSLSGYHQATYQIDEGGSFEVNADYVLIDLRIPERTGENRYQKGMIEVTKFVSESPDFRKVYQSNDIALYVRKGHETVNAGGDSEGS